jgi:hypothetical protein
LNNKIQGSGGLGNITVTTKVNITESLHSQEISEAGRSYRAPQAKEMV